MKPESTPDFDSSSVMAARPANRVHFPNVFGCIFATLAVFVLAGIRLPVFDIVRLKCSEMKALDQARGIGLALKLFASDHDGNYPRMNVPAQMATNPMDSNSAFACLFPTYLASETIFGNKLSAYQTAAADNVIDDPYTGAPRQTLQPGENVYSYVLGLNDRDNPSTPLVVDGTDGSELYNRDITKRGGVWKGESAIVIRLDNSGGLERLTGRDEARYVPRSPRSSPADPTSMTNLLGFTHFGKAVRLLDPAVGPRRP